MFSKEVLSFYCLLVGVVVGAAPMLALRRLPVCPNHRGVGAVVRVPYARVPYARRAVEYL